MTIVDNTRHMAEDVGNGTATACKIAFSLVRDIPQRLKAAARLMAAHPYADSMTATQRIKTAAMLLSGRPGPQHIDGWTR